MSDKKVTSKLEFLRSQHGAACDALEQAIVTLRCYHSDHMSEPERRGFERALAIMDGLFEGLKTRTFR